ncbi:DUF2637 domain-containing protein [Kribbella sp. NPDC005582]|uniref:DUF2637 domain-containing protein n=1 Tax=Kribbella sp. NPDC005582 TaxID=3156893 RepID=UPI0033A89019
MTQIADAPVKETAVAYYVQELTEGRDPSALELAERFGRTDRWARNVRAEGAERFAEARNNDRTTPESTAVPAITEPVPAEAADTASMTVELTPETSAEIDPEPAPQTTQGVDEEVQAGGNPENLASFAQNLGHEATTPSLRPSGYPGPLGGIEAPTAAPSWAVQDPTISLAPETVTAGPGTVLVPPAAPVAAPERETEPAPVAGTTEPSAEPQAETGTEAPEDPAVPGRVVAWLAFVVGIVASVAANVLHAADGGAHVAELIGAAFWPLALLLSIEVLTRIEWPSGWLWGGARFAGVGLVGAVAALLSYRHMVGLLTSWGEDALNAHVGPLAVDGLMLVAATALLAITHRRTRSGT